MEKIKLCEYKILIYIDLGEKSEAFKQKHECYVLSRDYREIFFTHLCGTEATHTSYTSKISLNVDKSSNLKSSD